MSQFTHSNLHVVFYRCTAAWLCGEVWGGVRCQEDELRELWTALSPGARTVPLEEPLSVFHRIPDELHHWEMPEYVKIIHWAYKCTGTYTHVCVLIQCVHVYISVEDTFAVVSMLEVIRGFSLIPGHNDAMVPIRGPGNFWWKYWKISWFLTSSSNPHNLCHHKFYCKQA